MSKSAVDYPLYLFHDGSNFRPYELLGCHKTEKGFVLRTWAPHARAISVVGDFNSWHEGTHPMRKITENGVWEAEVEELKNGDCYKFCICGADGISRMKSDPYAFFAQVRPETASRVWDVDDFEWGDGRWQERKKKTDQRKMPLNIYELHAGSWKRDENGEPFDYEHLARELIPYVKNMGYTHVELLPLAEHPFDGSWGYQQTGHYCVTSRYGTPQGLMTFVDACHRAGVGVIMDFVPAHFVKDAHGLCEFDGDYCYEYSDPNKMEHAGWGTRVFDYGRKEVRCYLIGSAMFFAEKYHVDGLRVDAVASMLYLDYARDEGHWTPNRYGGKENLEAIALLRDMNSAVTESYPGTMMIAEESTSWPMVTRPPYIGGLGFTFKWNMGWMNDTLDYIGTDPYFKQFNHFRLTNTVNYAFGESYVLPLSHDEVVHGKRSMIGKMTGSYEEKFSLLRAYYGYMMAHPGKKLSFMGNEIAQFDEWSEEKSVEWFLKDYPVHKAMSDCVSALNHCYLANPALWERDCREDGFRWLVGDDHTQSVVIFQRMSGRDIVIAAINFSPVSRSDYRVGVDKAGVYDCIFDTDKEAFGGSGQREQSAVETQSVPSHGKPYSVVLEIPALSCAYYRYRVGEISSGVIAGEVL